MSRHQILRLGMIALALLSLISPQSALANDSSFGGTGADLVPTEESRVTMKSEDILIEYIEEGWNITADYVFRNLSHESATLQVGFPEMRCPEYADCNARFWDMKTRVDGKPVSHRKGTLSKSHDWSKRLGTVWLFDVTFPPDKDVLVRHTYTMTSDGSVNADAGTSYIVRTGATWAGTIGTAKFTVKLPPEAHTVVSNLGKPSFANLDSGTRPWVELQMTTTNWTPKDDLHVSFHYSAILPPSLPKAGKSGLEDCERFPAPETLEQLRMCKNLIFAISGYPFKDAKLRDYFYGSTPTPWQKGQPNWGGLEVSGSWTRGLRELPNFSYDSIPRQNRWFLDYMEKEIRPALEAPAKEEATREVDREKVPSWEELKREQERARTEQRKETVASTPATEVNENSTAPSQITRPAQGCSCFMGGRPTPRGGLFLVGLTFLALARLPGKRRRIQRPGTTLRSPAPANQAR